MNEHQATETAFDALVDALIELDELEQLEQYNSELEAIDKKLAEQYKEQE